jgi:general secretion pathway protein L
MRYFIGLDIGPSSIRAVQVVRSFKGLQVDKTIHLPSHPDSLRELHADGWRQGARMAASLPETAALSRRVQLPFIDRDKLGKVIPFELEELLPLALEDIAVDFELLSTRNGRATVLAMAVPKAALNERLEFLRQGQCAVNRLTMPSLALAAYYTRIMKRSEDPVLLLNIDSDGGFPVVTLCAVEQGGLWGARTFLGSRALATGQPLWAEVQRTIAIWADERGTMFEKLYLAGADSTGPTLPEFLQQKLEIATIERCGGEEECDPAFIVAAGLAVLAAEQRPGGINFVRDQRVGLEQSRSRWRAVAVGLCLLLALASVSLGLRYRAQHSRHEQLATTVRELLQQTFPDIQGRADAVRLAKGRVAEARKRSTALGIGKPSLLELLHEVTVRIPKETQTEIKEVLVDADRIWIEAETDSFDAVERIKGELLRSGAFVDVSIHDARTGVGGARVRFRVQMTANMERA